MLSGGPAARWTALCVMALALGDGGTVASAQSPSFQGLGHLHGMIRESAAHGVSADGSVVVGYSFPVPALPRYSKRSAGPRPEAWWAWARAEPMASRPMEPWW